jgi:multiple sugar transport system permease protein
MQGVLARRRSASAKAVLTRARRRQLLGYLYISPWIVGFLAFTVGPMLASLVLSFFRYNLLSPPRFVGFENYAYSLTRDPLFWGAVQRTSLWAVTVIALGVTGALGLALLVNSKIRGKTLYRIAFFIPTLTPVVAAALIWSWILQPAYGPLNNLLATVGLPTPGWLQSRAWAVPGLLLIYLWLNLGGANMIIFLAGLQNVPEELYDAAQVDGANRWKVFRHVTLPMLSPTLFYVLVVGLIGGLRVFALPYMISAGAQSVGGPEYATWFYLIHLYINTFLYTQIGLGSALAWLFFLAVIALTILQFLGSRYWVYYESGG